MFIPKELFEKKKAGLWSAVYLSTTIEHDDPELAGDKADRSTRDFEKRFQTETEEELINSQRVLTLLDSVSKLNESLTSMLKAVDMVADEKQPNLEQLLEAADAYVSLINANKS